MCLHGFRDHALKLSDLRFDQIQALQIQHQHLSVQRVKLPAESIPQFLTPSAQPLIAQLSQPCRIRFTSCDGAQNALATCPQQIADYTGQFDLTLFEKTLQLALQRRTLTRVS